MKTHAIWKMARGPFYRVDCLEHQWETYGVQSAGCLRCGAQHQCANHLGENTCPLLETDEGGLCCPITGYCIPTLRLSDKEFVQNVFFQGSHANAAAPNITFEEIGSIVSWFLRGKQSSKCKCDEVLKYMTKYRNALVKNLKQMKTLSNGRSSSRSTCITTVISQCLNQLKPKLIRVASEQLCSFCSRQIFVCLKRINMLNLQNKKTNFVIGMLYLMKQGLIIHNIQWLPKVKELSDCLPHETNLEKNFNLSMKLVCETENEIKLTLRQQVQLT